MCDETGLTFEANAIQKALYYGAYCQGWLFAEDSGLSVDALSGAPGVYSARFAGPGADDASNNRLLLERLGSVTDRSARYICVIALVRSGTLVGTFRGEVAGEIASEPRGELGFGYDPIFFYPPFQKTFAEVTPESKQQVSHRGEALVRLFERLKSTSAV